jgi:hypothetical protein
MDTYPPRTQSSNFKPITPIRRDPLRSFYGAMPPMQVTELANSLRIACHSPMPQPCPAPVPPYQSSRSAPRQDLFRGTARAAQRGETVAAAPSRRVAPPSPRPSWCWTRPRLWTSLLRWARGRGVRAKEDVGGARAGELSSVLEASCRLGWRWSLASLTSLRSHRSASTSPLANREDCSPVPARVHSIERRNMHR